MSEIEKVSDYIEDVSDILNEIDDKYIVVYRGENQNFTEFCRPNIFRKGYLKENENFERNLFDEMTANKLTKGNTYLEKAIDAQHGGFPSRLLDVTYNSLIALYFAVTQGSESDKYNNDNNDGAVFVFNIEKLFCPSGEIINKTYNSIVNRNENTFLKNPIFQRNHKFIDHMKLNDRIIAQQGALILFQGDDADEIPECYYEKIIIPKESKKRLRKELKLMFGIYTGSIYPEAGNQVYEISKKSVLSSNNNIDYRNELKLVLRNLKRELDYYYGKIVDLLFETDKEENIQIDKKLLDIILVCEEKIHSYKEAITFEMESDEKGKNAKKQEEEKGKDIVSEIINEYNSIIEEFSDNIGNYLDKYYIKFSIENIKL